MKFFSLAVLPSPSVSRLLEMPEKQHRLWEKALRPALLFVVATEQPQSSRGSQQIQSLLKFVKSCPNNCSWG